MTLNVQKTGLALGMFLGGWHLVWSVLVALGVAQAIYDFILWAHMIHLQLTVGPFDVLAAGTLILVTFVAGYGCGLFFALVWNWLHYEGGR
jgi:hypothetical protein